KSPAYGAFRFVSICRFSNVGQVWSPLWSLQVENAVLESRIARYRAPPTALRGAATSSFRLFSDSDPTGISDHSTPSSSRPPAFGVRPPHCLRKKETPSA